jgi:acetyl-CoA acetyltransferase
LQGSFVQRAFLASVIDDVQWPSVAACAAEMAGIPEFRVSTDSTGGAHALYRARETVANGAVDCALVLGVHVDTECSKERGIRSEAAARAARVHMSLYGTRRDIFTRIGVKARQHAARNPLASEERGCALMEIRASEALAEPLTEPQCSPPRSGAAAVVLCSTDFARQHRLDKRVFVAAQGFERSLDADDVQRASECAARKAYARVGAGPEHLDLVELHDDSTSSELLAYEALHLTPKGSGGQFVLEGENTYGGLVVTNPSGGLLGQGNAGAANALAQCAEVVWQLRGAARLRQVVGARAALQHSVDPEGGMCVVTLYRVEDR